MRKIASVLILISIALFTVNASKCEDDLTNQLNSGTVCQSTDTACQTALNTLLQCSVSCSQKNSSDSAIANCVKTNCSNINNDTVKGFYNKMIACFDSVLLFSALFVLVSLLF
ncbi:transmembrane protein, putative (macronuclear) [Tetrahymena thermophila SB210]|uniref:Transmembrane protein, putative n=1 Tax=Tetrahymena thermophila (strain SB210) TaxID=312017 RepID=Q23BL0_TETTS|nr:transmembrane protein, putative [Tetrahymena thermophila SB210]EAR94108.3 transmembrane protein, putative [Tetrahymena thermophila SB210]|eukprot:XP_001014353.3 transmembrane protein, putative [Tetrahymena thermophila SB210]